MAVGTVQGGGRGEGGHDGRDSVVLGLVVAAVVLAGCDDGDDRADHAGDAASPQAGFHTLSGDGPGDRPGWPVRS